MIGNGSWKTADKTLPGIYVRTQVNSSPAIGYGVSGGSQTVVPSGSVTDEQIERVIANYLTKNPINSSTPSRIDKVTLLAANWIGDTSPYYQVVTISGITRYSQIDPTPSAEQLEIFRNKELAFVIENEECVVTVKAIGQKPQNDYIMDVTITEVEVK